MMYVHEHVFTAGAVRDNKTYRYCLCGVVLHIRGKGYVTIPHRNDDVEFYREMAERYGFK